MNRRLLSDIFRISVPAIITNITTPVLSMSDMAIAGHSGGAVLIASVALGGAIFNMLYWLFGFLRMGASGITANTFGAGDMEECHRILARALLIGVSIGALFIAFQRPLADFLLWIMDADTATAVSTRRYFSICIYGAPAVLGSFALTGWFVGMQNSKVAMWVSLLMDVFNILLSVTLVFGFGLGLTGIAAGTLCAQWIGFIVAVVAAVTRMGFRIPVVGAIFDSARFKAFFHVNTNIFLRTVCLVGVTMWFTRTGSMQGAVMLAANALLMQLFTGFSFFMDGFAFAAEALCGRFEGARQRIRLRSVIRLLLVIGCATALGFTVLYALFGTEFLEILSGDRDVTAKAGEYFGWAVSIPLLSFGAFVWDGVAIGMVRTGFMLASMIVASAVFVAVYALTFDTMGNHGLWLAFVSYLFIRGVSLSFMLGRYALSPICSK
ncbi:MAG: MATE family efflux transporter [Muribaculaceae bacterium]|nr:MATE family efflux transporter [Muribaculaceae bacterium]